MWKFTAKKTVLLPLGGVVAIALLAYSGYWYRYSYLPKKRWTEAKQLLEVNLNLMGLDLIEPYFRELITSDENCDLLIKAYSRAGSTQRMAYIAESCLAHRYDTATVYLGLAAFLTANGQAKDALGILSTQLDRFGKSYDIPYEMFRLSERLFGMTRDVLSNLVLAQKRAPPGTVLIKEPLRDLQRAGRWDLAYMLVNELSEKQFGLNDQELRAMITTTYRKQGDVAMARRFERPTPAELPNQ